MSSVIPLSSLKLRTSACIHEITPTAIYDNKARAVSYLQSMGFVSGRELELIEKNGSMFLARVEHDGPIALDKAAASSVMVKPLTEDTLSLSHKKPKINVFSLIANLFKQDC